MNDVELILVNLSIKVFTGFMEDFMGLREMLKNKTLERLSHYWDESTHNSQQERERESEREIECSGKEQGILTDSPLTLCLMSLWNHPMT